MLNQLFSVPYCQFLTLGGHSPQPVNIFCNLLYLKYSVDCICLHKSNFLPKKLEQLTSLPHPHLPLRRDLLRSFLSSYSKANECFFQYHLNLSEGFNSKTTPSFLENCPASASTESYLEVSPTSLTPLSGGGILGYFSRYDLLSTQLLKSCFVPTTAPCTFPSIPYLQGSRHM